MKRTLNALVPAVVAAALVAALSEPSTPTSAFATPPVAAAEVAPPPPALAAGTPTVDANSTPDDVPVMGDYRASDYAASAAALDPGLGAAVQQDLGLSAAEYLAEGEAASDAGTVLEALKARDRGVIDGRISGTTLTVYVATESAAQLARTAGARAVFGRPPAQPSSERHAVAAADTVRGGQPYLSTQSANSTSGEVCSVGFNGYALSNAAAQLVTAGHCADTSRPLVRFLNFTKPNQALTTSIVGARLGTWVPGTAQFGNGSDSSLLALDTANAVASASVLTWGRGSGAPLASTPVSVTNTTSAVVGAPICKSGSTSGWSCGKVLRVDVSTAVADDANVSHAVNSIATSACVIPGDSGGAALIGTAAAGLTSWTSNRSCTSTSYQSGFAPMVSSKSSVAKRLGSVWEPAVVVRAVPAVKSLPGSRRVFEGATLSGTASGAVSGNYVKLQFSGESKVRTANIVNGKWSMSLSGLSVGAHSYTLRAAWGTYSLGSASTGSLAVVAKPKAARYSGADRYATSVAISRAAYPAGAKVVYVATGENYPDALSAGPVAAKERAPLLLTSRSLPSPVRAEIARLKPSEIVVVGGATAVPASVAAALKKLAPRVTRISGADRFDTSRRLVGRGFPASASAVYLATGSDFPDALAAGAAAGAHGAPVLLVKGAGPADGATRSFLAKKHTKRATIVGGTAALSSTFSKSLARAGFTVSRLAGADRFATSEVIGRVSFATFQTAYFATGYGFPDALAGSAVAGARGAPLFTVPGTCVPPAVISDILNQSSVQSVVLLGGPVPIKAAVGRLVAC